MKTAIFPGNIPSTAESDPPGIQHCLHGLIIYCRIKHKNMTGKLKFSRSI